MAQALDGVADADVPAALRLCKYYELARLTVRDLFSDGRMIILSATGGAFPGDLLTMSVFAPKRRPGNYLAVLLTGTRTGR